jgi:hypothetical protein
MKAGIAAALASKVDASSTFCVVAVDGTRVVVVVHVCVGIDALVSRLYTGVRVGM